MMEVVLGVCILMIGILIGSALFSLGFQVTLRSPPRITQQVSVQVGRKIGAK